MSDMEELRVQLEEMKVSLRGKFLILLLQCFSLLSAARFSLSESAKLFLHLLELSNTLRWSLH